MYFADKLHLYFFSQNVCLFDSNFRLDGVGCSSVFSVFSAGFLRCCMANCSSLLLLCLLLTLCPTCYFCRRLFGLHVCMTCWQLLFLTVANDFQHSVLQMFGSYCRLIVFIATGIVFYLLTARSNMLAFITPLVRIYLMYLKFK